MGTAVRVPRGQFSGRQDEHRLPEITALIDPDQFRAMTSHRSGVVVIQGGAGTGKTTIALHRVAYLHYQDPSFCSTLAHPGILKNMWQMLPALGMEASGSERTGMGVPVREAPHSRSKETEAHVKHSGARRLKRHAMMVSLLEAIVREEQRLWTPR